MKLSDLDAPVKPQTLRLSDLDQKSDVPTLDKPKEKEDRSLFDRAKDLASSTGFGGLVGAATPELLTGAGMGLSMFPLTAPAGPPLMMMGRGMRGQRLAAAGAGAVSGAAEELAGQTAESMGASKPVEEVVRFTAGAVTPEFGNLIKYLGTKAIRATGIATTGDVTGDAMGGPATIGPATAFGPKGQEIGVASAFQMTPEGAVQQIPQEQPSVLDRAGSAIGDTLGRAGKAVGGMDDKTLARLGLTGGLGLLGAFNARKAGTQSQAATAEQKAIAQPYTEAGQKLMTQAQAGQMTPQSQAALNAAKAQIAQSVANRGGVGQQQAANQIAQLQANLLDNQYKYGLQVAQIGDNITLGAIKTGLQLDRQLQSSTQNFYAQLAQIAGGGNYALPTTLPRG